MQKTDPNQQEQGNSDKLILKKQLRKRHWGVKLFSLVILTLILSIAFFYQEQFAGNPTLYDHNQESFEIGPEPPIIYNPEMNAKKNMPENTSEEISSDDMSGQYFEPYPASVDSNDLSANIQELENYRLFLKNFSQLLIKLYNASNYSDELAILSSLDYPSEVNESLAHLEEVNNYLLDNDFAYEEVKLFNYDFLSQIIKLRKVKTPKYKLDQKIHSLEQDLKIISEYIYGEEAQRQFIKL